MKRFLAAINLLRRRMQRFQRPLAALLSHRIHLPAIEFFLTDTCNLRCAHCVTSSPFLNDANLPSLESFVESLSFLSRVVQCDELRLLGGEPLLNKDICSFIRAAKLSGIFRRIRVITNGLLLPKISEEFWQLTDIVRISLYPSTTGIFSEAKLESFRATAAKCGTTLEIIRDTHFMEAIRDTRTEDDRLVQHIFSTCAEAHEWSCYQLYRNRLYRCSRVHTLDRYLSKIGVAHENFTDEDGIIIDGRQSLLDNLKKYLRSVQPLQACSFCLGTSGTLVDHRQLTVPEIRAKLRSPVPDFAPDPKAPVRS